MRSCIVNTGSPKRGRTASVKLRSRASVRQGDRRWWRVLPLPDPIVVPIYVDAEEANFTVESWAGDHAIDVFCIKEGSDRSQIVFPISRRATNCGYILLAAINNQAAPVVVHQQKTGIRFNVRFDTKLNKGVQPLRNSSSANQVLYDTS
jgi:hypothetical protein